MNDSCAGRAFCGNSSFGIRSGKACDLGGGIKGKSLIREHRESGKQEEKSNQRAFVIGTNCNAPL